jgi:predicted nuclease of predicted toxin-antitoxin system
MKLLLDENLPKKLKRDFPTHEVFTVHDKGWDGIKNGELLRLLILNGFDCFLTFDKNIAYQQNFKKYPLCVIVLKARSSRYIWLRHLVPKIESILQDKLNPGPIEISEL